MDSSGVSRWFGEYLEAFAACGRGETETASLLAYYGIPLLLTTDDGFFALTSDDQVVEAVQHQVERDARNRLLPYRDPWIRGHPRELDVHSLPWDLLTPRERR